MKLSVLTYAAAGVLVAPAMTVLGAWPAQAQVTVCNGHPATIVGSSDDDTILGTDGDDVIVGGRGNDHIEGLGGNDVLCGTGGTDSLYGGDGNDRVFGGRGNDYVRGGAGDDLMRAGTGTYAGFMVDPGNDTWVSWSLHDRLHFEGAPDAVTADLVAGTVDGSGHDVVRLHPWARYAATGYDVLVEGSPYDDVLIGGPEPDEINGNGGADRIEGRGGDDLLFADHHLSTSNQPVVPVAVPDSATASLAGGGGDDLLLPGVAGTATGGAGDDDLRLTESEALPLTPDLSADGGEGRDKVLVLDATPVGQGVNARGIHDRVTFDLATGSLDAEALHLALTDFESVGFGTVDWHTVSTDYDITGTLGADEVAVADLDLTGTAVVVVHSLGGDDRIQTGAGDDTLDGGPGHDRAHAQSGTDTCISIEAALTDEGGDNTSCEVVLP